MSQKPECTCTVVNDPVIDKCNLCLAAPKLLAACEAAIRYDSAIVGRAARGEVDLLAIGGAMAEGDDLDALYDDWQQKAQAALRTARSES